jgi:hypothetical protein
MHPMLKRLFDHKGEAAAEPVHMQEGEVLIKVTEEFLRALMTRTHDGKVLQVEMGDQKADGTYEPQIAVLDDGKVVVDQFIFEEWRAMKNAGVPKDGKPKLAVVKNGRIIQ